MTYTSPYGTVLTNRGKAVVNMLGKPGRVILYTLGANVASASETAGALAVATEGRIQSWKIDQASYISCVYYLSKNTPSTPGRSRNFFEKVLPQKRFHG